MLNSLCVVLDIMRLSVVC